ncbi:MAG: hypothetical protein C0417_05840 [Chlorobiaceae bacterium]|nr:hypothetical protein [Chlorobiaceae bacterium]
MNPKTKTSIIQHLTKLAENASEPFKETQGHTRHIMSEGVAFSLSNEFLDSFEDVARTLLQDESWSEKFSEKYVDDLLQKVLAKTLRDGNTNKLETYLDEIINEFSNYSQERIVYIPLAGIQMSMDELSIGKVVLKKMKESDLAAITSQIEKVTQSLKNTSEEKALILELQQREIGENLRGHVCSVFKVIAEPEQARERAEEETRRVIDLLRFAIPALYPKGYNIAIGLQGEVFRVSRWIPIISTDGKSFNTHANLVGPLIPFEINDPHLEHMIKIGVFKVSKVLAKLGRDVGDFERVVLRALHWLANSQIQEENENKLLNLITCLETFLTPRDGDPIGTFIAEGVAILLADDLESKIRLKKRVKELYHLRSAVSHGGRKAILDSDLVELENITGALTMTLIDRMEEFQSHKALFDWIESKKLGGK